MNIRWGSIRWGILGYGAHARSSVIPAFSEVPSASLCALGTSSPEKIPDSLRQDVQQLVDYQALISSPDVDAVYIALPNHLHHQWCMRSLEAGKHVLCEKPLACSYEEVREILDTATKTELLLAEGFMYRFHPQHKRVRELIEAGEIGSPNLFEAQLHYDLSDTNNIRLREETGGGSLLDVGCYLVDSCQFIFSKTPPERISASMRVGADSGVDESCSIKLSYADGSVAKLSCACNLSRENHYTVTGTEGSIHLPSAYLVPRKKRCIIEHKHLERKPARHTVEPFNQLSGQLDSFSRSVADGRALDIRFNDRATPAKILDAIRRSVAEGREVQF